MAVSSASEDELAYFGPFRLSVAERLLAKGEEPVAIGGRALDILIALVARAGEVVSRRELIERVWPDVIVEEATLRVHLSHLRKALEDGRDGARYIANVPGRGYSFVAPVQRSMRPQPAPPAVVLNRRPQKLPPRLERMVGRDETVTALSSLLMECRFVSVVGPGGIGKTTVAVAVAHALVGKLADRICFVDLAALGDPSLVGAAIASGLGLYGWAQDPVPGLLASLVDRPFLIVLDNCEHVIEAVASIAERLFREAPLVYLLITSREALRVEGENVHLLLPLEGSTEEPELTAAQALASPAVQLFMERAAASGHRSELSDADAPVVAGICRQLDGIALAIELAAGRVGTYGIRGTADLLSHRFRMFWHGRRSALPRHQTLQAMLDWSYNLLSEDEQLLLRRLAVFVGPFTLEDAIAVAGEGTADAPTVISAIARLVEKSLVGTLELGGLTCHRLLETTRAYAAAKLSETGEESEFSRRHAHYYATRLKSEPAGATALGGDDVSDHAPAISNIRAALDWSFSTAGDARIGVELAARAAPLFVRFSLLRECELWCERGLAALQEADRGTMHELALREALAVSLMYTRGKGDEVRRAIERSIAHAEARGERQHQLHRLAGLNVFLTWIGDFQGALASAERGVLVAAELGEQRGIITAEWMLGVSHHVIGNQDAAQRHCERGLELDAVSGSLPVDLFGYDHRVRALVALARISWLRGLPEQALSMADRSVEEAIRRKQPISICISLVHTIPVYLWGSEFDRAAERIEHLLAHTEKHSLAPYRASGLGLRGELMILTGNPAGGVQLLRGALETLKAQQHHILATVFFRALAEGTMRCGQLDEAVAAIDRALLLAEQAEGTFDLPDLLRTRAEICLARSPPDIGAAEDSLVQALTSAQKQGALGWELKAAIPLARLWAKQGWASRARDLLDERLRRFKEGFETADVRTATNLVAELSHEPTATPPR